jgi:hypothetical protein
MTAAAITGRSKTAASIDRCTFVCGPMAVTDRPAVVERLLPRTLIGCTRPQRSDDSLRSCPTAGPAPSHRMAPKPPFVATGGRPQADLPQRPQSTRAPTVARPGSPAHQPNAACPGERPAAHLTRALLPKTSCSRSPGRRGAGTGRRHVRHHAVARALRHCATAAMACRTPVVGAAVGGIARAVAPGPIAGRDIPFFQGGGALG